MKLLNKIKKKLLKSGFTLFEVLIALMIFLMIIDLLYNIMYFRAKSEVEIESSADLNKNSRHVLTRFTKELQEGKEVLSPPPGAPQNHILFINDNDETVLYLYKPDTKTLHRALVDELTGATTAETTFAVNMENCSFAVSGNNARLVEVNMGFGLLVKRSLREDKTLKTANISTCIYLRNH